MSRFSELSDKPEDNIEITGAVLACQECRELVHDGVYSPSKNTLTWVCSRGHQSHVGNFFLSDDDFE